VAVKDGDAFYNRILWVDPKGSVEHADKRHLFSLGKEDDHYSPGKSRLIVDCQGWNINLMCCYDLRFPAWCRNSIRSGKPDFDLQIFMANWPDKRVQHWDALLLARAIENQSYVCGVNIIGDDGNGVAHSGHSAIYSGMGDALMRHTDDQESIQTTELSSRDLEFLRRSLSFLKDADQITLT
jgi:omega-amidase